MLHRSRLRASSYEQMGREQSPLQWRFTLDGQQSGKGQMKYQLVVNPVLKMNRVVLLRREHRSLMVIHPEPGWDDSGRSFIQPPRHPSRRFLSPARCLEVFWALISSSESEGQKSLCVHGVFILEGKTYINEKK